MDALKLYRSVYDRRLAANGHAHEKTLSAAGNLALSLGSNGLNAERTALLRGCVPVTHTSRVRSFDEPPPPPPSNKN